MNTRRRIETRAKFGGSYLLLGLFGLSIQILEVFYFFCYEFENEDLKKAFIVFYIIPKSIIFFIVFAYFCQRGMKDF